MSDRCSRAAIAGIIIVITGCDPTSTEPEAPGDPLRIAHVSQINPGGGTPKSDVWGYVDAMTGKEYALLGAWGTNALFVIDVSDAANPVTVATVDVPAFDMKVWQHYAYTVTGGGDGGRNEGRIVDLADPTAPVVVGSFPSSHNITIDDQGFLYLSSHSAMRIFDLNQDPVNPQLVWLDGAAGGHDAFVISDILFNFGGQRGADIYDVTDRAGPRLLSSIRDPTIGYYHSGSVSRDGTHLFVCDEFAEGGAADVSIWDIRDMSHPVRVGSITDSTATIHNLYVVGDLAFISHYSAGFRVFDVSDPTQPVATYEYDTSPDVGDGFVGAWGVYPFTPSGHVYVSDMGTGLHVFSVTGSLVP